MPRRLLLAVPALCLSLAGCNNPRPTQTGFLSDYTSLQEVDSTKLRYVGPELPSYNAFIVDPVELRIDRKVLSESERAEVARYFRAAAVRVLEDQDLAVVQEAGIGVARVRIALTDVHKAVWFLNLHPGAKLTGAGLGGASMETEVIDSVSGRQIAALVQSGRGNQFELDTFSSLDDVKDVIDAWARNAGDRLEELRAERPGR